MTWKYVRSRKQFILFVCLFTDSGFSFSKTHLLVLISYFPRSACQFRRLASIKRLVFKGTQIDDRFDFFSISFFFLKASNQYSFLPNDPESRMSWWRERTDGRTHVLLSTCTEALKSLFPWRKGRGPSGFEATD